jgi:hypothetical protein
MKGSSTTVWVIAFVVLCTLLYFSQQVREPYMDKYCNEHGNCQSCMKTSGCAWCPLAKKCLLSSSIKSDEKCNAENAITALEKCESSHKTTMDDALEAYDDIVDRPKPPAVYTTSESDYTHQTIAADVGHLRDELAHFKQELPDLISATVRNTRGN